MNPTDGAQNGVPECIFCSILDGKLPAKILGETERSIAIADIDPKAPLHALVIPRQHIGDVTDLAASDPQGLADLVALATDVAGTEAAGQFRLIFNTGRQAGQTVFHVHGHVLAGDQLGWTPA